MSNDTPNNNPHNPPYGDPGATQPVPPQPRGQGAVNGAPQGQQYGMTGGKYGTSEYNPNQYTGTMDRPSTVDKLLKLTLASLGLYVLNGIIGLIAAGALLEAGERVLDLAPQLGGPLPPVVHGVDAGRGGDREAVRDGDA